MSLAICGSASSSLAMRISVADVKMLYAPVPYLSSGDLPGRNGEVEGRSAGFAGQFLRCREHVRVAAGQSKLAYVYGQFERDVQAIQVLQHVSIALYLKHGLIEIGHGTDLLSRLARSLRFEVSREDVDGEGFGKSQLRVKQGLQITGRIERATLRIGPSHDLVCWFAPAAIADVSPGSPVWPCRARLLDSRRSRQRHRPCAQG